jgi:hypothetical protein
VTSGFMVPDHDTKAIDLGLTWNEVGVG